MDHAPAVPVPADVPGEIATERIALVDLLDRLLAGGVVVSGEITLSVADVDLITISLRALIASVSSLVEPAIAADARGEGTW
jgi:hypothetical protein